MPQVEPSAASDVKSLGGLAVRGHDAQPRICRLRWSPSRRTWLELGSTSGLPDAPGVVSHLVRPGRRSGCRSRSTSARGGRTFQASSPPSWVRRLCEKWPARLPRRLRLPLLVSRQSCQRRPQLRGFDELGTRELGVGPFHVPSESSNRCSSGRPGVRVVLKVHEHTRRAAGGIARQGCGEVRGPGYVTAAFGQTGPFGQRGNTARFQDAASMPAGD